jgi:hypothetical protein
MATAKLNVWITQLGRPCTISGRRWVVAVARCDGSILEWRGTRYESIPAPNGHAEIEVPPGCYVISASMHTWWTEGVLMGNWWTHDAIVQVSCGDEACVILYAPTAQHCIEPVFEIVLPLLAEHQVIPGDLAEAARENLKPVLEHLRASRYDEAKLLHLKETVKRSKEEG